MKKKRVMQIIAQQGYNIGLGAKKHFSTYDIVEKVNGWINFIRPWSVKFLNKTLVVTV